jgi:hypothetical protein
MLHLFEQLLVPKTDAACECLGVGLKGIVPDCTPCT